MVALKADLNYLVKSITITNNYYDVLSHYWKYIFCENSDVRGFILSS